MKIKATSTGTPTLSGAQAFAWMLAAVTGKRPVLKVVKGKGNMKLANCNEHSDSNDPGLPCRALRHDDGRRVTAQEMWGVVQSMPNLEPVILWLENGCDPKEAAKELRQYQKRMRPNGQS